MIRSMLLDKDTLTFQAEAPQEMLEWIKAIESCMSADKKEKNLL